MCGNGKQSEEMRGGQEKIVYHKGSCGKILTMLLAFYQLSAISIYHVNRRLKPRNKLPIKRPRSRAGGITEAKRSEIVAERPVSEIVKLVYALQHVVVWGRRKAVCPSSVRRGSRKYIYL